MRISFLRNKLSISTSLSYWFCAASIGLVVILSEGIYLLSSSALTAQSTQRLEDLAFQITTHLDQGMFERYREVQNLSHRAELTDAGVSVAEKERMFEEMKSTYPQYEWIGVTDAAGRVIASNGGLLRGADVSLRSWYVNANNGIYVGDVHDAKLLAKLIPNSSGEPPRFIDIAFPIRGKMNNAAGVLGVHMSWRWAEGVEKSVIEPEQKRGRLEALILNSEGKVILGPKDLVGTTVSTQTIAGNQDEGVINLGSWANRRKYLVGSSLTSGFQDYKGLGWTVVVRQPVEAALAPVWDLRAAVMALGLVIALLFSVLGRYSARRITKSIRALSSSAKLVTEGVEATLDEPQDSYPEVDQLWHSLQTLNESHKLHERNLEKINASLERRVLDRTQAIEVSKKRLRTITNNLPALIAYVDSQQRYQFMNNTFEKWYQIDSEVSLGQSLEGVHGYRVYSEVEPYIKRVLSGEPVTFELAKDHNHETRVLSFSCIPEFQNGIVIGFYSLGQDITDSKRRELALEHEVGHDTLTKLPNRQALMTAVSGAVDRSKRSGNAVGLMFLDLNKFKQINDTFGHAVGDQVLIEFARRLKATVRETDFVARLAGDEFVVVAEGLTSGEQNARQIAENIVSALQEPMTLDGFNRRVATSIGIAVHTGGGVTGAELLHRADEAMYQAKKSSSPIGVWAI